jgi:hypothetical protein
MISFNSFVQLAQSDGVVIQYSIDNLNIADSLKEWNTLGAISGGVATGVDWYNGQSLASKPGDQTLNDYGWTGSDLTDWLESKHSLDTLGGKTTVVFRFALASINTTPQSANKDQPILLDGFAIDNFRIGNRTRTVLVENFKNLGNTANAGTELSESNFLRNSFKTNGTTLVKINYDVGFPGLDPFNQDNPADPGARALYYNITNTPVARLDGNKNDGTAEALLSTWGQAYYDLRSLQLAQADISINAISGNTSITDKGVISFNVVLNAKQSLNANSTLHIAVLEQSIGISFLKPAQQSMVVTNETTFDYVLKKMIPSAAGIRLGTTIAAGSSQTFGPFTWTPDLSTFYGPPQQDIAIVAFLQDDDTREVYQTEVITNLDKPADNVVTGIETLSAEQIKIYPNPSDKEFLIELPGITEREVTIQIIDEVGRITPAGHISEGQQQKTVSTESLANGVYIVQLGSGSSAVRRKIVVTHR